MTAERPLLSRGLSLRLSTGGSGFVGDYLGGGGQGSVYIADCGGRKLALKWYHPDVIRIDVTLRSRILSMIRQGPPDRNFVWPLAMAEIEGQSSFGYLMPLISADRRPLQDLFLPPPKRLNPSLAVRAAACLEIATSFQKLHATGYCYQDINFGGFFVDPERGSIQICDADNIAVDGIAGGVFGTRKFMAPEVLRRETIPSTRTDLYSMAVLFFYLLFNWHPLDGRRENAIANMTPAVEMDLYGRHPLFIFDPQDTSNGPVPRSHDWVVARWAAMPAAIRLLFTRAFTEGLMQPARRPIESEWRNALDRLRDSIVACGRCTFEHGIDRNRVETGIACVTCGAPLDLPPLLNAGHEPVLLKPARRVFDYQLDTGFIVEDAEALVAVESHPRDPAILGLHNARADAWPVEMPNGTRLMLAPGRTVRIVDGLVIAFGERRAQVSHAEPPTEGPR